MGIDLAVKLSEYFMGVVTFSSRLSVLSIGVATALFSQMANAAEAMPSTTLQTITVTANTSVRENVQEDSVYIDNYTPAAQASH